MSRILIRCPSRGAAVHTGHHMTNAAFAGMAGRFAFRCPACAEVHHWSKEDAWQEAQRGLDLEVANG